MKMAKRFLGLMIVAVAAMFAVSCDASTCAGALDCGLVGEWKAVNGGNTIKFEADGKFTSSSSELFGFKIEGTLYAKQVTAGMVTLCNEDGDVKLEARYFFFEDKLSFNGKAYERKN